LGVVAPGEKKISTTKTIITTKKQNKQQTTTTTTISEKYALKNEAECTHTQVY